MSIAEDAGIDLGDSERVYLASIGCYVKVYIEKWVKVLVEGLGTIIIPIAFAEYIASDIVILGRQGFFEAFEITF